MIIYHGSDVEIANPEIRTVSHALDFGAGFYTTTNYNQAHSFALKIQDRRHSENAVISLYQCDLEIIQKELNILWFNSPTEQWLDYVSDNINEETAIQELYHSALYTDLERESSKLWHLSPVCLAQLWHEEKICGRSEYPEEV